MAIITRRMNCFDPLKLSLNYLDPVVFRHTRPGDAKHKIKLMSPNKMFCQEPSCSDSFDTREEYEKHTLFENHTIPKRYKQKLLLYNIFMDGELTRR